MEKKITLTMKNSKDIEITVNDNVNITIEKNKRVINADDIYRLIDYSSGDVFSVVEVNEFNIDAPVLSFFYSLLLEIVDKVNEISGPKEHISAVEDEENEEVPF